MIFFLVLFILSFLFSFFGSFTTIGVRGMDPAEMTGMDWKIKDGSATFWERFFTFLIKFPIGLVFPPFLIIAGIVYAVFKLFG